MLGRAALLSLSILSVFVAQEAAAGDYAGGSAVKWAEKEYNATKLSGKPYAVYIVDSTVKNNVFARFFEGKEVLAGGDAGKSLGPFLKVKIKIDNKSWPAEWRARAEGGTVLLLSSSDGKRTVLFDKTQKDILKPESIATAAKAVMDHEAGVIKEREAKKAEAVKEAKELQAKAAAEAKIRKEKELAEKKEKDKPKPKEILDE